jgi:hypothetical protein
MKTFALIFLTFTSLSQSLIINCNYSMWNTGNQISTIYNCYSSAESTGNSKTIEEVRGTHLSGKNNANVEAFQEQSKSLQFIPTNLVNFFPNLKVIIFLSPLLQVVADDFKPFPNLL